MSTWTLEGELKKLAGLEVLEAALARLGLLPKGGSFEQVKIIEDWKRSGAETYLLHFAVSNSLGDRFDAVIKAYVPFIAGRSIDEYIIELVRRRKIAKEGGVAVPYLYFWGAGVIIEDWIPHSLSDLVGKEEFSRLSQQALSIARKLDVLGFSAPYIGHDLRVANNKVVLVDFGEDLGPPMLDIGEVTERGMKSWLERVTSGAIN